MCGGREKEENVLLVGGFAETMVVTNLEYTRGDTIFVSYIT